MAAHRRSQIDPYLSLCTELNYKWMKDFNIRPYAPNLIEEELGNSLELIDTEKDFMTRIPLA